MNTSEPSAFEPESDGTIECDPTSIKFLSIRIFKKLAKVLFDKYGLEIGQEQPWGFVFYKENEFAIWVNFRGYMPELEFCGLRSRKEFGERFFLIWYLMAKSRKIFFPMGNYELLQECRESRVKIVSDMWKNVFSALETYCGDLLDSKADEYDDFKVDYTYTQEKLKESLHIDEYHR